jgi:hypothetical protein
MDEAAQLDLVRKAITCRVGGCCLWDSRAERRARADRNLGGLTPATIMDLLQDHVAAHPEAVTTRRETRAEYRGAYEWWFRVIVPVDGFTQGLFVELILVDPDPDVPVVWIVNAHEQRS